MGIFTGAEVSLCLDRFIDGWKVSYSLECFVFFLRIGCLLKLLASFCRLRLELSTHCNVNIDVEVV